MAIKQLTEASQVAYTKETPERNKNNQRRRRSNCGKTENNCISNNEKIIDDL